MEKTTIKDRVMQFGTHYMLDGYGAPEETLSNKEALTIMLKRLPGEVGMHPICDPVVVEAGPNNMKDPGGISGFVMIAESHISFHTFPKRGFVSIDIYTCQDYLDTDMLTKKFVDLFKLEKYDEHPVVKRGTKYPVENIY
jgi:S-adenosylmethionine decarboxylase